MGGGEGAGGERGKSLKLQETVCISSLQMASGQPEGQIKAFSGVSLTCEHPCICILPVFNF